MSLCRQQITVFAGAPLPGPGSYTHLAPPAERGGGDLVGGGRV